VISKKLLQIWLVIRPKTLTMALTPLLAASALAFGNGVELRVGVILAIAVAALLVQIGTNLYNDARDFEKGTDRASRIGPRRAASEGWFTASQLKHAAFFCFLLCWIPTAYLIWIGGWPIFFAALLSVLAGYAYSGGPFPISATPLGEVTAFIFFGLVTTGGFYYLHTGQIAADALWMGAALGLFSAATLLVNNYRDLESDRASGRATLAIRIGRPRARLLYVGLLLLPFPLLLLLPGYMLVALLSLPMALHLIRRIYRETVGPNLNSLLASTAKLQVIFCLLACAGLPLAQGLGLR
jgi:1,4-dihydroxy-2-naphthoate octaprenyltransferase